MPLGSGSGMVERYLVVEMFDTGLGLLSGSWCLRKGNGDERLLAKPPSQSGRI